MARRLAVDSEDGASATVPVSVGETLTVSVGGQGGNGTWTLAGAGGFNGGGAGGFGGGLFGGGGGGGASDVRRGGLDGRLVVAGGGGGADSLASIAGIEPGDGGSGGGESGQPAAGSSDGNAGGGGGTAGSGGVSGGTGGTAGGFGAGGTGAAGSVSGGAGGGGGWSGGVGGGTCSVQCTADGGGGGSGHGPSGVAYETGVRSGNGFVAITYTVAVNQPPIADSQALLTSEDTALPGTATGSDADCDPLTFRVFTPPANGSVDMSTSGAFTYTPAAEFNGVDQFFFVANDGTIDSLSAPIVITVTPVNDPPVADGTVTFGSPRFTYTPAAGFSGTDQFTYLVTDPAGATATATAIIDVGGAPPTTTAAPTTTAPSDGELPETGAASAPVMWSAAVAIGLGVLALVSQLPKRRQGQEP